MYLFCSQYCWCFHMLLVLLMLGMEDFTRTLVYFTTKSKVNFKFLWIDHNIWRSTYQAKIFVRQKIFSLNIQTSLKWEVRWYLPSLELLTGSTTHWPKKSIALFFISMLFLLTLKLPEGFILEKQNPKHVETCQTCFKFTEQLSLKDFAFSHVT